jgi:hemoglobin/transferrin/lactoferrin receptor protein
VHPSEREWIRAKAALRSCPSVDCNFPLFINHIGAMQLISKIILCRAERRIDRVGVTLGLLVGLAVFALPLSASAQSSGPDLSAPPSQGKPSDAPVLAPFNKPSGGPLQNPASLADQGMESDIETATFKLQSEATVETAMKRETKLRDIPLTVSWIPEQELAGTGEFTLCDAIQYFPGMECRRGAMRKVAVSARGLGSNFLSNRLLLLSDGRPETDPWTGQFYADETTPLTNVKQIEVIRGPGSSLYGSNAFSGVINVIHNNPEDLIQKGHDFGVDARFMGGQFNTFRLQTTAAGKAGDLSGLVNYYGYRTDGPHLLNDPSTNTIDNQEWARVQQVSGKVLFKGVSLDAAYTDSDIGRPGGQAISQVGNCGRCHYTPNDSENAQLFTSNLQVDEKVNDHLRVFAEGYTLFKRRFIELQNEITGELQPSLGKRNRTGGEVRAVAKLSDLTVTLGGDVKHDIVNNENVLSSLVPTSGNIDDVTHETIFGGFIDGEYHLFDKLVLGAGARIDYYALPSQVWQEKSTQLSPRASIVFHALPELTLRTNYGRAFRAPTLAELAVSQQMYASTLEGNPLLKAETLDTVEVAADYWPAGGAARFTATGFYNKAHDFINQTFLFGSTSQFQNIGDARVAGVELEAAAQVKELNSSFDVAYQYLDAVSQPYNNGPTAQLDFATHHRVYFRARTRLSERVFADFYGLYVGPRMDASIQTDSAGNQVGRIKLPGYVSANMRLGADVLKGLSASLVASNLFNSSYEEMHGFPVAPFQLFAEFRYSY